MALSSYQDLKVWQKSRSLVGQVYELCSVLPQNETFGLCSQMKRAAVSIPSNIAEGYRRNNRKEYIQFIEIALGSAAELETQLILTQDLFKLDTTTHLGTVGEIQSMLLSLRRKLQA